VVVQPQNRCLAAIELRQRLLQQHSLLGSHARCGDRNVRPLLAKIDRFALPCTHQRNRFIHRALMQESFRIPDHFFRKSLLQQVQKNVLNHVLCVLAPLLRIVTPRRYSMRGFHHLDVILTEERANLLFDSGALTDCCCQ
jgi:hypothetical protein